MKGKMAAPVSTLIRLAAGLALLTFVGASGLAQAQASLESPSAGSFQESGVSLIRGWVCQASRIEISIDNGPVQRVAYGTVRPDTQTPSCLAFCWSSLTTSSTRRLLSLESAIFCAFESAISLKIDSFSSSV